MLVDCHKNYKVKDYQYPFSQFYSYFIIRIYILHLDVAHYYISYGQWDKNTVMNINGSQWVLV